MKRVWRELRAIGLDIGSTSTKYALLEDGEIVYCNAVPTGWSSADASQNAARDLLLSQNADIWDIPCVSTGYGRVNVVFADKSVTEITCHAMGACNLFGGGPMTVIDIGGQDTKVIAVRDGAVLDFSMNDKCSAGTGRFLEVMANALGLTPSSLCELAEKGGGVTISSMCTVFAESEVVGLIGRGVPKKDIAFGIVDSITSKVLSQCGRVERNGRFCLTGGLCECPRVVASLSQKLNAAVETCGMARYAGAIGAALCAEKIKEKTVRRDG